MPACARGVTVPTSTKLARRTAGSASAFLSKPAAGPGGCASSKPQGEDRQPRRGWRRDGGREAAAPTAPARAPSRAAAGGAHGSASCDPVRHGIKASPDDHGAARRRIGPAQSARSAGAPARVPSIITWIDGFTGSGRRAKMRPIEADLRLNNTMAIDSPWAWPGCAPSRSPGSTSRTSTCRCRSAPDSRVHRSSACPTRRSPIARAGAQRARRDGPRPAAQAHHHRLAPADLAKEALLRSADRARAAGQHGRLAGATQGYLALGELALDGAILRVAGAACGGRRLGARARPDLSGAVRRRGPPGSAAISRSGGGSLLALINHFNGAQVLGRGRACLAERPPHYPELTDIKGPGDRQTRARDRRRRRPPAADRPARGGQVDARGAPAWAAAAAGCRPRSWK